MVLGFTTGLLVAVCTAWFKSRFKWQLRCGSNAYLSSVALSLELEK
jgi:hypothetical protein